MESAAYTEMVREGANCIWIGIAIGVVGLVVVCLVASASFFGLRKN